MGKMKMGKSKIENGEMETGKWVEGVNLLTLFHCPLAVMAGWVQVVAAGMGHDGGRHRSPLPNRCPPALDGPPNGPYALVKVLKMPLNVVY
jgi:hypothetical protein